MEPLIKFLFSVGGKASYHLKLSKLLRPAWESGCNPWLFELEWPERADEAFRSQATLQATLWRAEGEWSADRALEEIEAQTGQIAQLPELEEFFPEAFATLFRELGAELCGYRVLFPALGATWNRGADARPVRDPHARRNSLGRRLARAVHYALDRDPDGAVSGTLGVAKLFPCTHAGEEFERDGRTFFLQIHR